MSRRSYMKAATANAFLASLAALGAACAAPKDTSEQATSQPSAAPPDSSAEVAQSNAALAPDAPPPTESTTRSTPPAVNRAGSAPSTGSAQTASGGSAAKSSNAAAPSRAAAATGTGGAAAAATQSQSAGGGGSSQPEVQRRNVSPREVMAAAQKASAAADSARATGSASTTTPAAKTASPSGTAGDVKVNNFMSYNSAAKRVTVQLLAAYNNQQGGFNFNGGSNGSQTITVPQGWTVSMHVVNKDAIPHSAIVITEQKPVPNAPESADIPRAYTAHVSDGLAPQNGADDVTFKASKTGRFMIVCGVPGHGPSGMWIYLDIADASATPAYKL